MAKTSRTHGDVRARVGLAVGVATLLGCERGAPPAPEGVDAAVALLPGPSAPARGAADAAPAVATAEGAPAAGDPGALPQTRDKPSASGPALEARVASLWDAIVHDEPERAMPCFFPVKAYEQVKAIPSPASDWRRRLVAAYKRDIHGLSKRLGDKASRATLIRLDIPDERARWVEPNEETNRLGYWRVYGSRILYELDGKERALDVTSLISWRGEWYVVHLTGFK